MLEKWTPKLYYKSQGQPDIALLSLESWPKNHVQAGSPIKFRFVDNIQNSSQTTPVVGLGYTYKPGTTPHPFYNNYTPKLHAWTIMWAGDQCPGGDAVCHIKDLEFA